MLSEQLKQLRIEKNLTQVELAKILKLSETVICRAEYNDYTQKTLDRYNNYFGTSFQINENQKIIRKCKQCECEIGSVTKNNICKSCREKQIKSLKITYDTKMMICIEYYKLEIKNMDTKQKLKYISRLVEQPINIVARVLLRCNRNGKYQEFVNRYLYVQKQVPVRHNKVLLHQVDGYVNY